MYIKARNTFDDDEEIDLIINSQKYAYYYENFPSIALEMD